MKSLIRNARLQSGLNASEVARHLGISRSSVSAWENPNKKALPSKENLTALADLYRTSVDNLIGHLSNNVEPGPDMAGVVPVISFVQAGNGESPIDIYHPGYAEEYIFCPVSHGKSTYALRVRGQSMMSDNMLEKSYPPGSLIYCDPDQSGCVSTGQNIIAKLSDGIVTFKQYRDEDGLRWLRPLNPEYKPIHDEFEVIALVIGNFRPE